MSAANLYVRARRLVWKLVKLVLNVFGYRKTTYVWDRVPFYRDMWRAAADRHGLELVPLSDEVWELRGDGRCVTRINNCYVELDDPVTLHIAGDKALTYALLEQAGLPVPPHATFTLDTLEALERFVAENAGPYVIKPASGTGSGIGISTHLYSFRECLGAVALASLYDSRMLVEKFVVGEVYRLLFVGRELVNAVCRRGVRVVGDGSSALEGLVEAELERGGLGPYPGWDRDLDLRATTRAQGLERGTVLRAGQSVLVKSVAGKYTDNLEIRTVYTDDVTDDVSEALIDDAAKACRALRSDFCGVDLITTDPARSLGAAGGVIGEINTTPGLHHHYSLSGAARGDDVVDRVMALLLRPGERSDAAV